LTVLDVQVKAGKEIPPDDARAAQERFASLDRYAGRPLTGARLTLRRDGSRRPERAYVADADVLFDGRTLAAHATGRGTLEATDAVTDRLRRQVRRVVDAEVAQRNEPAAIRTALAALHAQVSHRPEARLKPPGQRKIVRRRTYADRPLATLEAAADLLDDDLEFYLFRHMRTGEDVVVHRRDDGRLGLLFPPGSILADENDVVVPEASRYPGPLTLDAAASEMDELDHRFLYFIDAVDGRGKVIYLRHDGDYGLVEPE
jgi:ribosome-associated translation inhibitor RaiA